MRLVADLIWIVAHADKETAEREAKPMTGVQILSVPAQPGRTRFQAIAGKQRGDGDTAGQALDAISPKLPRQETAVVVVQPFMADEFFSESQSSRLRELMLRWRECRDTGTSLADGEQAELDSLVETELLAATNRAAALALELTR